MIPRLHFLAFGLAVFVALSIGVSKGRATELPQLELAGENPLVGIILCSSSLARYTPDTLPNKVMAREYHLALPAVKKLEAELAATRKRLERAGRNARLMSARQNEV